MNDLECFVKKGQTTNNLQQDARQILAFYLLKNVQLLLCPIRDVLYKGLAKRAILILFCALLLSKIQVDRNMGLVLNLVYRSNNKTKVLIYFHKVRPIEV